MVVTDLTRMHGERVCLAGYRLGGDSSAPPICVRPLFERGDLTERWLFDGDEAVVRPRAVVELDLLWHRPEPPHAEDWLVHPRVRRGVRAMSADEFRTLLDRIDDGSVADIFGAPILHDNGWYLQARTGARSLGTIRPARVLVASYVFRPDRRTWDYRLAFVDASGEEYRLAMTDLAVRHYLDHLREQRGMSAGGAAGKLTAALRAADAVYLRIGLTRGWEAFPDRCFLQITGVHTFPDYLDGRCYADFLPEPPSVRWRLPLDEVPF